MKVLTKKALIKKALTKERDNMMNHHQNSSHHSLIDFINTYCSINTCCSIVMTGFSTITHLARRLTHLLLTLLMLVLLISCASNLKPETQGKKMTTFFTNNNNTSLPKLTHPKATEQTLNADFIRTQATELQNRFPRLPNPVLNMFIVPHLTKGGHPVPGYTTHFKLYKLDQYALPGESL